MEDLKGEFSWITCIIIDKAYHKHANIFSEDSSLRLGEMRSEIKYMQDTQVNTQVLLLPQPGLTPFARMDTHGIIIESPFLEYVNNPETKWSCCIGVPYGKDLWKVDDSKEQNGSYKIASALIKKELIKKGKTPHVTYLRL